MKSDESLRRGLTTRRIERRGARAGQAAETGEPREDAIAVEEPLELRVDGETVAVTMRTPGDDARLAVGFLFGEGIIQSIADLGTVSHCGRPGEEGYGNVLDVRSGPGVTLAPERVLDSRRFNVTTSSCGVCGRRSIDDLLKRVKPIEAELRLPSEAIGRALETLSRAQPNFSRSGGLHAAAAIDTEGARLAAFEDVGRHNAVDKTIGELLYRNILDRAAILAVSGRASFEIVQKAAAARIPIVASVSAPSSLAIDLAAAARVTLCGFVRGAQFNLYTHPERLL